MDPDHSDGRGDRCARVRHPVRAGRALILTALAAAPWLLASALEGARLPDPAPFDAVLATRVRAGGFDYRGATGQDRKRLSAYLANLGDASLEGAASAERTAFWINSYNAWAIQTLLDNPGKTIREVDGAFAVRKHRVAGEAMTLDEIERRLRKTRDPRIHFAIVCASKSCPPLAGSAYRAERLSEALDRQARAFVNDSSKNAIDRRTGRVALSMIFSWNRGEFERDGGTLARYVSKYVSDPETARWLEAFQGEPEFLPYDWSPNQP
jgi:hypothetical protein